MKNLFLRKFIIWKNFSWQAEKAKHVAIKHRIQRHRVVTLLCRRSTELWNFYFWEKRHIHYAQLVFHHRNCKWICGVSFGKEVYRQQLPTCFDKCVSLLRLLEHWVQAWLPRQDRHFTCKIVGGVVMNCLVCESLAPQDYAMPSLVSVTRKEVKAHVATSGLCF